ncbi:MAG TPA: VCBS repeat-containing protein [Bryobacteraceae bacterium]|nr:VCBS repeat-containing protein [Bryobacteraceae bacterium]
MCALLTTGLLPAALTFFSSKTGQLEPPNPGTQQTSATVFDIDGDGLDDFVITERTAAPAAVWYKRTKAGWSRHVLESAALRIEAGSAFGDVDGDGDLDFIAGGDATSNQVWWWENPTWQRRFVKNSGERKHHDQMWGDFDGDGRSELVFWNQGGNRLVLARVPPNVRHAAEWPLTTIYSWSGDSEPEQRAAAPHWKRTNEHEGLAAADIDLDGRVDIVGGGRWFKHRGGGGFEANIIDAGYAFSRVAAGQLIEGGRPEVVLVVGDGVGPLILYEWTKGTWRSRRLLESVDNGHSLAVVDYDRDGDADIFCAEMRLDGGNSDSKAWLLLGDGKGNFRETVLVTGFDHHESRLADLDGDGTLDLLGKPYNHETPALHIWLNSGRARSQSPAVSRPDPAR